MSFDTDDIELFRKFRSVIVPSTDVLLGTALAAVTMVVGLTTAGIARSVLGLSLVLFLDGYAIVAALLPATPEGEWVVRRVALPFGVSLALLAPMGLAFSAFGVPFSATAVLGVAAAITVGGLLIAGRRRVHLTKAQRGQSMVGTAVGRLDSRLLDRPTTELVVNALTLVAVLTAMAGLVFAVVAPAPTPQYASFSVLTENESGELVAADYPSDLTAGESADVVVQIANEGPEQQGYTVLVQQQRFDQSSDSVTERAQLARLNESVSAGETSNRSVSLAPEMTGEQMRIAFLLYPGDPPENPTVNSAEEHLFLWVNVTDDGTTGESTVSGSSAAEGSTETPTESSTDTPSEPVLPDTPTSTETQTGTTPTETPTATESTTGILPS